MNALKHMEVIFGAVLGVGCIIAALPDDFGGQANSDAVRAGIPVVVIKAKRMTALEKRESLGADASARPAATGS